MEMEEVFTICPNCPGVVDNTIKGAAVALSNQGYASVVYITCPTCGAQILARLKWTPVIVSVELKDKSLAWGE